MLSWEALVLAGSRVIWADREGPSTVVLQLMWLGWMA